MTMSLCQVRWQDAEITERECVSETRARTRLNNVEWGEWSGSFTAVSCVQTATRYRYRSEKAEAGMFLSEPCGVRGVMPLSYQKHWYIMTPAAETLKYETL